MAKTASKKINITPLGDRVLVKRVEAGEETKGGIVIPDSAREKPQEAEVIALGSGKRLENGEVQAFEVKAGDRVLISKYGGTEIQHGEQTYLVLREEDILAIIG